MFNRLREIFTSTPTTALVIDTPTGAELYAPTGDFVGSYSRRRDAFRAARRRGFEVA